MNGWRIYIDIRCIENWLHAWMWLHTIPNICIPSIRADICNIYVYKTGHKVGVNHDEERWVKWYVLFTNAMVGSKPVRNESP